MVLILVILIAVVIIIGLVAAGFSLMVRIARFPGLRSPGFNFYTGRWTDQRSSERPSNNAHENDTFH